MSMGLRLRNLTWRPHRPDAEVEPSGGLPLAWRATGALSGRKEALLPLCQEAGGQRPALKAFSMSTHPQEGFRTQQLVSQKGKGLMGLSALLGQ